jgi:hypothetical protein
MGEIIEKFNPSSSLEAIQGCILALLDDEVLVKGDIHHSKYNRQAFWDRISRSGSAERVAVRSLVPVPGLGEHVESLLLANEIQLDENSGRIVLLVDDYLRPEIAELTQESVDILIAKPIGNEIWIGPCLSEKAGMCVACLRYWLKLRRWPAFASIGLERDENLPACSVAWLPSTLSAATGLIATAASEWASVLRSS